MTYSVREGSSLPAWATFIDNAITVSVDTEGSKENLGGTQKSFKFEAHFQGLTETIDFRVLFLEPEVIAEEVDETIIEDEPDSV